jgi:chromosome segregation ATPase
MPRRVPEENDDGEGSATYRAKFAVPGASSEGEFTQLERELVELEGQLVELEGHLSAPLAAQKERDQRLAQLTEEFAWKSALLEQAEANGAEAAKRVGLKPREHASRLPVQTSLVVQKDAELVNMQPKLDELLLSRDQHVRALEQQIGHYETELAGVRAELEAKKSELEAVRLRLTDAEIGWAKSKAEADTLRALTTAGLVSTDEDRMTRGLLERIRAMESEMTSMRWSEKSLEAMETRNEG